MDQRGKNENRKGLQTCEILAELTMKNYVHYVQKIVNKLDCL